jgi:hypothetical protein
MYRILAGIWSDTNNGQQTFFFFRTTRPRQGASDNWNVVRNVGTTLLKACIKKRTNMLFRSLAGCTNYKPCSCVDQVILACEHCVDGSGTARQLAASPFFELTENLATFACTSSKPTCTSSLHQSFNMLGGMQGLFHLNMHVGEELAPLSAQARIHGSVEARPVRFCELASHSHQRPSKYFTR